MLLSAASAQAAGDLYFSEYVEGTSNNKALEIYNGTGAGVDLSAYQVRYYFNGSASAGTTINLSGTLADGDVFVLAHASAEAAILTVANQTSAASWYNGDDAIALVKSGVNVDVIGQIGFDPGSEWGSGDASTADNTLRRLLSVTGGDGNGGDAFVPSAEWAGFPTNTFSGLGAYPDGGVVAMVLTIPEIQGAGHVSPVNGELVETTGVVTAVDSNGFYLQDAVGDGNPETSDGLFVFTSSAPGVSVGNSVKVTASVSEFQPGGASTGNLTTTELGGPTVELLLASVALPAPAILGSAGSLPPVLTIDDDNFAVFDPASDGIDFYEAFEGMRVQVQSPVAVSSRNKFGEIYTLTDGGAFATGLNARSGITITEADGNPERIQVQLDAQILPGFEPLVNTGDLLGDIVGVVSYDFGNFEIKPTQPFAVSPTGLLPETADAVPADDHLSIASFNVLNLDPKIESLAWVNSAADIDDDIGDHRFERLGVQIVANLLSPDIIALQEVQDSDGAELTGVTDASLTYQTLVAAIEAAGGPTYEYRDIPPVNLADGGQPGGNIRVGFLFNPARVSIDESSLQKIVDPNLGDGDAFADSRKPLVAAFDFQGRRITFIDNHFSSKGGSTPLFGLVQPPVNGSVAKRVAQAQVVHDVVADLLALDRDANVVVLGDLNEFAFNEPLAVLKGEPTPILFNLTETLPELERYSYVFDGNAQSLDHILVSASLAPIAQVDAVHVNAEFQEQASDHDPLLARLAFAPTCQPDLGFGGPGAATLAVCGDPLGPTGIANLVLSGLPAGTAGLLFFGLNAAPLATHGGHFVPLPLLGSISLVDDDLDGVIDLPIPGVLVGVPVSVIVQFVYPDASLQPFGFGFSNALGMEFLGG